jgi:hypothetical protein
MCNMVVFVIKLCWLFTVWFVSIIVVLVLLSSQSPEIQLKNWFYTYQYNTLPVIQYYIFQYIPLKGMYLQEVSIIHTNLKLSG